MRIVSAAIKFNLNDKPNINLIMSANDKGRHADVRELMHELNLNYDRIHSIEGFMTDSNTFVDRLEAKKIAVAANQLIVPIEETYPELYSEDVW